MELSVMIIVSFILLMIKLFIFQAIPYWVCLFPIWFPLCLFTMVAIFLSRHES